jgi:hypothetical protein
VIFEWEETLGVICDLVLFTGDALCVCALNGKTLSV